VSNKIELQMKEANENMASQCFYVKYLNDLGILTDSS